MTARNCQLYLISPSQINLPVFRKELEAALSVADKGFIGAFQLRLKDADDATIKRAIKELLPICRAHEVVFIINDRVDICADLQCDGVHVGQEDLLSYRRTPVSSKNQELDPDFHRDDTIPKIRALVGEKAAIGVTCHASRHLAMEAAEAGADYVAFGAFYETTSKPKEKLEKWGTPTPDILEWWSTYTTIPCVAIGGITPENCTPLVGAGADFIAVITAVWNHPKGAAAGVNAFADVMPAEAGIL